MAGEQVILTGDVGGTNVRFALARASRGKVRLGGVWKKANKTFGSFDEAVAAFRQDSPERIDGASFGLAGAVVDDHVDMLNHNWSADGPSLRRQLGVSGLLLANDFMAMARAAPELDADDVVEIAPGEADPKGAIVVTGPGTGLGVAVLRPMIGQPGWIVVGGEGGHQAFAPQTSLEFKVADRVRVSWAEARGYVSNEMIAAGAGFDHTLPALAHVMELQTPKLSEPEVLARAEQGDALCEAFYRLRARTVMTSAGDMALASNATGGVYLAGGIGARMERWFKEREALDRFYNRGLRTELLAKAPIRLIISEKAPLLGAAHLWLDQQTRGWL